MFHIQTKSITFVTIYGKECNNVQDHNYGFR